MMCASITHKESYDKGRYYMFIIQFSISTYLKLYSKCVTFYLQVIYIILEIQLLVLYISENVEVLRYAYQIFDPLLCLPLLYQYPTNIASSFDTCQYLPNCMMV